MARVPIVVAPALVTVLVLVGVAVESLRGRLLVGLGWNLLLAWIPYLISLAAAALEARSRTRWWILALLAGGFVLFFPNAPYLVTDVVHLGARRGAGFLARLALFLTCAALGWWMGLASLHTWRQLLTRRIGARLAWAFVVALAFAAGFGIYLGRVRRWNSWDAVVEPELLFRDVGRHVLRPAVDPRMLILTLAFGLLLIASYCAYARMLRARQA